MTNEERQEKQLRVLSQWLLSTDDGIDAYTDGAMERAIKHATSDCMRKIGDYIAEILDYDDEQLNRN